MGNFETSSRRESNVSESSVSMPESISSLRSRTPSVDIEHPISRRSSRGQPTEDGLENVEIRCKSGSKKRKGSAQNEETPFKVQLKHREADKEAGLS